MIKWIFILSVVWSATNDPLEIARINRLKRAADQAFQAKDYQQAAKYFRILTDSLQVNEQPVSLNLAHSYFHLGDSANARTFYAQASQGNDPKLKSIAYQQLGVLHSVPQSYPQALQYLKASIKADPTNASARYDYEVVKKLMQQQKEQQNQEKQDKQDQKDDQQQDQDKQDQQSQKDQQQKQEQQNQEKQDQQNEQDPEKGEKQDQQQEPKEGKDEQQENQDPQQSLKEKLDQMNMTEEKAMMILEALKNSEIQYLQQQKRKATEKPKSGKPDW